MRKLFAAVSVGLGFAGSAGAFHEADLAKLKATGGCQICDESNANLSDALTNRMFTKLFRFLLLPAAILALAAHASADQIDCPVEGPHRRGVNWIPLPGGWWNTPFDLYMYFLTPVDNPRSTRIVTIGGRSALQCVYDIAGNVQRYAPEGMTCTPNSQGFSCVITGP